MFKFENYFESSLQTPLHTCVYRWIIKHCWEKITFNDYFLLWLDKHVWIISYCHMEKEIFQLYFPQTFYFPKSLLGLGLCIYQINRLINNSLLHFTDTFNVVYICSSLQDLFKKIRDTKGTFHAKMGSIKTEMLWT